MDLVCDRCGKEWDEQPCFVRAEKLGHKVWLCCQCSTRVRGSGMAGLPDGWHLR